MFFNEYEEAEVYRIDRYSLAYTDDDPEGMVLVLRALGSDQVARFFIEYMDTANLAGILLASAAEGSRSLPESRLAAYQKSSLRNRPLDPATIQGAMLLDEGQTLGLDLGFGVLTLGLTDQARERLRQVLGPEDPA